MSGPGNSVGGGGAAGAALDFIIDGPITGGPVVIGAGGAGVVGGAGGDGSITSVTINAVVYVAAPGQGGSRVSSPSPATPAFALGGITLPGSSAVDIVSGDNGMPGSMVSGDSLNLNAVGGHGGSGEFGIGGEATTGGGSGSPGQGRGSGGGGAASATAPLGTDAAGGDGAPGVVIIEEFS